MIAMCYISIRMYPSAWRGISKRYIQLLLTRPLNVLMIVFYATKAQVMIIDH